MPENLTLEIHHHDAWHRAATVEIASPIAGTRSSTMLDYDMDYVTTWDAEGLRTERWARDYRAVSVRYPLNFVQHVADHWPPFLLDLMPQGGARMRLARHAGYDDPDNPKVELSLLLHAAGGPIGNVRIREAWEREEGRIEESTFRGVSTEELLTRSDWFDDTMERFGYFAGGSSGVQGEWPKALFTQARDGLWYPDPLVRDTDAVDHAIVKLRRGDERAYELILQAEAAYLEIARAFGLRVGRPLRYCPGVLLIPRFDRRIVSGRVHRLGQESLVAAKGVAEFGHIGSHEDYLRIIADSCTDPVAEVSEYILRDLLNLAMGNTDNHGRNTALQKLHDNAVALTPLYDFTPTRLDPRLVPRSTRWTCLNGADADPDLQIVVDTATEILQEAGVECAPGALAHAFAGKAGFLIDLPTLARKAGLSPDVVAVGLARHQDAARAVERLERANR